MGNQILTFGNIEIEMKNFTVIRILFIGDVDTEKVLVSNKLFGEKL